MARSAAGRRQPCLPRPRRRVAKPGRFASPANTTSSPPSSLGGRPAVSTMTTSVRAEAIALRSSAAVRTDSIRRIEQARKPIELGRSAHAESVVADERNGLAKGIDSLGPELCRGRQSCQPRRVRRARRGRGRHSPRARGQPVPGRPGSPGNSRTDAPFGTCAGARPEQRRRRSPLKTNLAYDSAERPRPGKLGLADLLYPGTQGIELGFHRWVPLGERALHQAKLSLELRPKHAWFAVVSVDAEAARRLSVA